MTDDALTAERLRDLDPREAAARFVVRRAEGWGPAEAALFEDWLRADAGHPAAFEAADRGWAAFDAAGDHEILAVIHARALAARPARRTPWRAMALAASILVAAGLAMVIPRLSPQPVTPAEAPAATFQYATARGEIREVRLPDGSVVTLDADSAVDGRFTDGRRSLTLRRGRALFAVAPNHARPFAVAAGGREVVAVGTRFDVDLAAGTLTVTVLEGRVTVAPRGAPSRTVTLGVGQRIVDRDGRPTPEPAPVEDAAAWRQGVVAFDNQTVAEAVTVMNRYGGQRVLNRDPRIGALRVSGQFRAGEGDRFAATLADLHGLRVVRRAEGVELVQKQESEKSSSR